MSQVQRTYLANRFMSILKQPDQKSDQEEETASRISEEDCDGSEEEGKQQQSREEQDGDRG